MKKDLGQLHQEVIQNSEADYWEDAVEEWEIVGCDIDETAKEICICGHEGLKYCFTIQNRFNGAELYPIGSSCILQFGRNDLKQTVSLYEQLFRIRGKYNNHEMIKLSDFSRKLLLFLLDENAFQATEYNGYNLERDYDFMLQMFNQRSEPTVKQQCKITAIIVGSIIPYIKKMEI